MMVCQGGLFVSHILLIGKKNIFIPGAVIEPNHPLQYSNLALRLSTDLKLWSPIRVTCFPSILKNGTSILQNNETMSCIALLIISK